MRWGFKSISDYFIGDILKGEDDLLERSKIRTVFWFSFLVILFLIAYLPVLFSLAFFTVILAGVTIILLATNIYFLKSNKSYKLSTQLILTLLLGFVLTTLVILVPSNPSGYLMWSIFLILITNFTVGKEWTIGLSTLTILALIVASTFAHFDFQPASFLGLKTIDISSLRLSSAFKLGLPFCFIIITLIEFVSIGSKTNEELNHNLNLQRNLNNKIRKNDSKYRRLVEGVGDIVVELDQDGILKYANQAFSKISGYSSEELIGKPFSAFIKNQVELAEYDKQLKHQIQNRITMTNSQFRIYSKAGESIWLSQNRSIYFDELGNVASCTSMARDVTSQKKVNDHLKEAKISAEKASLAKAQFLSSMSHEIRTPLNAVIGTINLIDEENLCLNTKTHFDTLKYSADTLLKLVSDILDLNKLDAKKLRIEKSEFNLKSTIAYIQSGLQNLATKKGLDLSINYDKSLPEIIIGDSLRLTQILNSVVHNALKFTKEGGVELAVSKFQQTEEKVQIHFSIVDTGIGISEENIESIFGAFNQDNDETIRQGGGLGLAISNKLLKMFDSEIAVESELGKGSRFSFKIEFDLPYQAKSTEQKGIKVEQKGLETSLQNRHILIVEDNLINQKVTLAFLKKWGSTYKIANNGKEAVEMVQQERFDLILMDLQMPVMNGVEATKEIRNFGGVYSVLPIIALTASAVLEVRQNAMKAGLDDFITKPFKPENLNQVIRKHLDAREPHQVSDG